MRLLFVTAYVPCGKAVNAAPLVVHGQLKALAARHEVRLGMGVYRYRSAAPRVLVELEARLPDDGFALAREGGVLFRRWTEAEGRRWRRYQAMTWRRFDRTVVFTARDAALVRAMAPETAAGVRVIPFGVDLPACLEQSREEGAASSSSAVSTITRTSTPPYGS